MAERDENRTHRSDQPVPDDTDPGKTGEPATGTDAAGAGVGTGEPDREAEPTAEGPADIDGGTGEAADTAEPPDSEDVEPDGAEEMGAGTGGAAGAGVGTGEPDEAGEAGADDDEGGGAGADDDEGGGAGGPRRGTAWWAYAAGAVAVAIVLYGIVAAVGGTSDSDSDTGGGAPSDQPATGEPPGTTAPAGPPEDEDEGEDEGRPPGEAELVSELSAEAGDGWAPAGDDVTLGGTAHRDTIVSGPVGPCDEGAARSVTYDLAGAYTRLDGAVGLVDDDDAGPAVEIAVELDGERVWWKSFATGEAGRMQVDVTAARDLTITAAAIDPGTSAADVCARAGFADLRLT